MRAIRHQDAGQAGGGDRDAWRCACHMQLWRWQAWCARPRAMLRTAQSHRTPGRRSIAAGARRTAASSNLRRRLCGARTGFRNNAQPARCTAGQPVSEPRERSGAQARSIAMQAPGAGILRAVVTPPARTNASGAARCARAAACAGRECAWRADARAHAPTGCRHTVDGRGESARCRHGCRAVRTQARDQPQRVTGRAMASRREAWPVCAARGLRCSRAARNAVLRPCMDGRSGVTISRRC